MSNWKFTLSYQGITEDALEFCSTSHNISLKLFLKIDAKFSAIYR
jgi:hypothetical protein